MSIQSDLKTALASVASGRVYTDAAPQDAVLPFVIFRRLSNEPLMLLNGYSGVTRSSFIFESWATTKSAALTTASAVATAIDSAAALNSRFREPISGDDYEPNTDQFVELVQYSFWHS
jgi:hypothetical protein